MIYQTATKKADNKIQSKPLVAESFKTLLA